MAEKNNLADTILDEADWREWNEISRARQTKIQLAPNVQHELDTLARDGANAAKVLALLSLVVPGDNKSCIELFKSRKEKLTSLADKVERISKEVENALSDPFNSSAFVSCISFPELGREFPRPEDRKRISSAASKRIKPILNLLRAEAKQFSGMSRIYSRFKRDGVLESLLRYIKESTGQFHDETMASLLQAAHDELRVDATFSAEQLRILRRRNFPTLTRKRKKLNLYGDSLGIPLG
jgi:hypothetical protein